MTTDSVVDLDREDGSGSTTEWMRSLSWLMGGVSIALGGAVLVGWYTHTVTLIQLNESFAPMQYNTALGFILCGAGILLLTSGSARMAMAATIVALLAATIGVLTLIEYFFHTQLGLDQLFLQHYITVNSPHPGRMAPTTAALFTLVGIGLILLSRSKRASWGPLVARAIAAVVVTLAIITVVAYTTGLRVPFAWIQSQFTWMAVNTAAGFIFLGSGLFLQARPGQWQSRTIQVGRLPYVVGAVGLVLAVLSWGQVSVHENARIREVIATETNSLRSLLEEEIKSRIDALTRMAHRWEFKGGTPRDEWEADALRYSEHQIGYLAITWADSSLRPRWSVRVNRSNDNDSADMPHFAFRDEIRSSLIDARDRHSSKVVTEVVDFAPDSVILNFYRPMFSNDKFIGFLVASYLAEGLTDQVYAVMQTRHLAFIVRSGGRDLFGNLDPAFTDNDEWGQVVPLLVQGLPWRLRAWPTPAYLAALTNRSPELVAGGVALIVLLLSVLMGFAQAAYNRGMVAEDLALRLEQDIAARTQTEEALQDSEARFRTVADSALDAMIFANASGKITYWNHAAATTFGFTEDEAVGQPLTMLIPEKFRDAHKKGFARFVDLGGAGTPRQRIAVVGLRNDGSRVPVELSLISWTSSGELVLAAVARDMTENHAADAVLEQTIGQLADSNAELKHFNDLAVGRELRMIELKREINRMLKDAGKPEAYDVSFASTEADVARPS